MTSRHSDRDVVLTAAVKKNAVKTTTLRKASRARRARAFRARAARQQAAELERLSCAHPHCKKHLLLAGTKGRVGFRCHYCLRLYCDRHARRHFGDLTHFSNAKWYAGGLLRVLRTWLETTGEHVGSPKRRRKAKLAR